MKRSLRPVATPVALNALLRPRAVAHTLGDWAMRHWVQAAAAVSLGVCVLPVLPVTARAQTISFIARHVYAVAGYPRSVAVGDFNGDGIPDLAVANGSTVAVLLGRGNGLFHQPRTVTAGSSPVSVAVGDVNRDGRQDLVMGGWENAIWVLLGNGDGTFQPAERFATYGLNPGIALGDFNGDGVLDVVTANQGYGTISVLLGHGDGTFGPYQTYGSGRIMVSVAVGDFNRDGRLDIAAADEVSNNVPVFLGNGDGTFQAPLVYAGGSGTDAVVMTDLNRDGNLDLVTANFSSSTVFVDFGNGAGGVNAQASVPVGSSPYGLAVADFNGDGAPDLAATSSSTKSVSVLPGNGDRTFGPARAFAVGSFPYGAATGDFNGDGLPDLAVVNADSGTVSILVNNTNGAVIGERVAWTGVVNAAVNGNSIRKTGGCDGCFDAGAFSSQQIDGTDDYAEVEFTATDTSLLRVAGLTHATSGTTPEAIDFGIRLQGGYAEVRENGLYRASTAFAAGDSLRIAINAGTVSYLRNGVPFYTSANAPVYPLAFAVALANLDAAVEKVSITGTVPGSGGGGGGSSSTPVTWTQTVNVAVIQTTIAKTGGCDGCFDASAVSSQQLVAGDGFVEFTADDATPLLEAGLTHRFDSDPRSIDFGIRLQGGYAEVIENGVYRTDVPFVAGDIFRISIDQGILTYSKKNGPVLYASQAPLIYPLFMAVGLANLGASISDPVIGGH